MRRLSSAGADTYCQQIALHFVQDTNTRFELAIECGNLDVAMETARTIDRPECWERLAQQALKQGNHKVCNLSLILRFWLMVRCRLSRKRINKRKTLTNCRSYIWQQEVPTSCRKCKRSLTLEGIPCRDSIMHCMREMLLAG